MSGTNRDLLFHRLGLEHIQTSNCGANYAVVLVQNDRSCLGPVETYYSGPNVIVLQAKTTDDGWDP